MLNLHQKSGAAEEVKDELIYFWRVDWQAEDTAY